MTLWDYVFPPRCICCNTLLSPDAQVGVPCSICRRSLLVAPEPVSKLTANVTLLTPFLYGGSVRKGLWRLKFTSSLAGLPYFASNCHALLTQHHIAPIDLVTWVPASFVRNHQRGYCQAQLIAKTLAKQCGLPYRSLLTKADVPSQSKLTSNEARAANVANAFHPKKGRTCQAQHVLLVDDIVTSTSTLRECVACLQDMGAAQITCVAVASAQHTTVTAQ